jgi:hypothetical protein
MKVFRVGGKELEALRSDLLNRTFESYIAQEDEKNAAKARKNVTDNLGKESRKVIENYFKKVVADLSAAIEAGDNARINDLISVAGPRFEQIADNDPTLADFKKQFAGLSIFNAKPSGNDRRRCCTGRDPVAEVAQAVEAAPTPTPTAAPAQTTFDHNAFGDLTGYEEDDIDYVANKRRGRRRHPPRPQTPATRQVGGLMKFKSLILALAFAPAALVAAERNDVPSCYAQAKIENFRSAPSGRLLTVVVDQTTPLTPDLQKPPGATSSASSSPVTSCGFTRSAPTWKVTTPVCNSPASLKPIDPAVLGDVPMMASRKFDACLKGQSAALYQRFGKAFSNAMGKSSSDIPRSEILFSLKSIGDDIKNAEGVNERVILLMSDMLEYSDFGSFYTNNGIREINPAVELAKVEKQQLLADFSGARVYVHGAAFVPTNQERLSQRQDDPEPRRFLAPLFREIERRTQRLRQPGIDDRSRVITGPPADSPFTQPPQ